MKGMVLQHDEQHSDERHDDTIPTSLNDNLETDDNVALNFERHLDMQEESKRQRLEDAEGEKPSRLTKSKLDFSHALTVMEKIYRTLKLTFKASVTALPPT